MATEALADRGQHPPTPRGAWPGSLGPDDSRPQTTSRTRCASATACAIATSSSSARARRPAHIQHLADELGVAFDRDDRTGSFLLGREGGHSARRIVHAKDITGAAIQDRAAGARAAERGDRITMLADHMAIDLLTTAKYGGPNAVLRRLRARPEHRARSRPSSRAPRCWPPAARARSTCTPPTPTSRPATASPWPTGPARGSRTWSSSSSTPPACSTREAKTSSSARRCAARAAPAPARRHRLHGALPRRWRTSPRATSWRAPSTPR